MDNIEEIAKDIVDAAYKVHKEFGRDFSSLLTSNAMHMNFVNVVDRF